MRKQKHGVTESCPLHNNGKRRGGGETCLRIFLYGESMKTVTFTLNGKKYGLYYNGMAMFEIQDRLGDMTMIFDIVRGRSKDKFLKLCDMIEVMSVQYAQAMKQTGYGDREILRASYIQSVAAIRDIAVLQDMVIEAVNLGLEQEETDEDREIDLGLIEFQKKTDNPG